MDVFVLKLGMTARVDMAVGESYRLALSGIVD